MHNIIELLREIERLKRRVDYIEPRENIGVLLSGQYAFGEIYVHDAVAAQTVAPGAAYTKSDAWTVNGLYKNCTPDQANDQIIITKTGIYRVDGAFSFYIDTPNVNILGACFLNNIEQDQLHFRRFVSTANDEGAAGVTGLIDVTQAPIVLDWRWRHDDAGNVDITITYANLNAIYVGAT